MNGDPRRRSRAAVVDDLERALAWTPRPNPVVVLWRWRWEVLLAASTSLAAWSLVHGAGVAVALAAGAACAIGAAVTCALWRGVRDELAARVWCIVTPHRLRVGCVQARLQTRNGTLPVILWTSPAAYGERVLVWCRAGTAPGDFVAARETLAAACWAEDVLTTPDPHHRHLLIVEVIRHREHAVGLLDRGSDLTGGLPPSSPLKEEA